MKGAAPKWKGDWDSVGYVCDTWIDIIETPEAYTSEICFVEELTQSGAIYDPGIRQDLDALLEATPPPLLDETRVQVWQSTPARYDAWMDAVYRTFIPNATNAYHRASLLGNEAYEPPEQRNFIGETINAQSARVRNDPLNPKSVNQFLSASFASRTGTFKPGTETPYRQRHLDMVPFARYQPETWQLMAQYTRQHHTAPEDWNELGGRLVPQEISSWEKSIIASNYAVSDLAYFYEALADVLLQSYYKEFRASDTLREAPTLDYEGLSETEKQALKPFAAERKPFMCPFLKTRFLPQEACKTAVRGDLFRCESSLALHDSDFLYMERRLKSDPSCSGFAIWNKTSKRFMRDLKAPVTLPLPRAVDG
ncbi:hypothetical protein shim_19750 [Shimia sp. SK013]|uniref:hypothetical protein n=1 Tax=Shimia sp. SK013 TaxID=1389006 RepID=UPI0006CCA76B|nr:hypothetical protein [Shimia sp. SK013]KPA22088.1 hypothetical protein shim_19750 [Shimia sp. SK013]